MTTVLIDGSNLSIIHLTANPAVDENGVPIGMVKGFLNTVLWINKLLMPDRIFVFFDGKNNSSNRKQIFSEYKEGRKAKQVVGRFYKFSTDDKAEKNREYQFFVLRELLDLLPISQTVCNHYESDDAISYCVKNKSYFEFDDVFIVSCDKDFYQLIGPGISIYNPMSKKIISTKDVIDEYGIHPANWLLYRSITGDKSDNIDGIAGMGPKTVLKMFDLGTEFPYTVEDLAEVCEDGIKNPELSKEKTLLKNLLKIKTDIKKIERNWELMNLKEPMLSSSSKQILDDAILNSDSRFLKLDFWRKSMEYSVGLDLNSFDNFKHLVRGKKDGTRKKELV